MIRCSIVAAALALVASLGAAGEASAQDKTEFVREPLAADAKVPGRPTRLGFVSPAAGRVVIGLCEDPDLLHIVVPSGGAVRAAEAGTVAYAGDALKGFRNLILIRHQYGWVSAYENADIVLVKRGDIVRRGQPIARIGDGSSPVHFELRHRNVSVDPRLYLEGGDTLLVQATRREPCG